MALFFASSRAILASCLQCFLVHGLLISRSPTVMKEINYGHELGNLYNTEKQFLYYNCILDALLLREKTFQKEASSDKEA